MNERLTLHERCHLGKVIRYDTVTKYGWSVSASTHGIQYVIDRVLASDWEEGDGTEGSGKPVPDEIDEQDCVVSRTCSTHSRLLSLHFRIALRGNLANSAMQVLRLTPLLQDAINERYDIYAWSHFIFCGTSCRVLYIYQHLLYHSTSLRILNNIMGLFEKDELDCVISKSDERRS